jgi:ribonuclease HI
MINSHTSYLWTFNCGKGSNTRAELMGAWASLTLAHRLSISDMILLGDSKIVIDWLKKKANLQAVALESWKERIKETISLFRDILLVIFIEKITWKQISYQRKRFQICQEK